MRILVVDDDSLSLSLLEDVLTKWGHEVVTKSEGTAAWVYLQSNPIDVVVTDWVMPGLNGIELCRRIRGLSSKSYIYTILLAVKDSDVELIQALEAGADDFVGKPVNLPILRARIRAAERIIRLGNYLLDRNAHLKQINKKLIDARISLQRDLEAGASLQRNLLPPTSYTINGYHTEWIYMPHSVVAGDFFNILQLDEDTIGFYLLDAAGHGIPAALTTFTVSKMLSSAAVDLKTHLSETIVTGRSVHSVVEELNKRFQNEDDANQYFTMIYGHIDIRTGGVTFSQAGHPAPFIVNPGEPGEFIGDGGFPVGWFPDVEYTAIKTKIEVGGRIVIYSDGLTECTNSDGELFTQFRLKQHFEDTKNLSLRDSLDFLLEKLSHWSGQKAFDDDLSVLAIEREE